MDPHDRAPEGRKDLISIELRLFETPELNPITVQAPVHSLCKQQLPRRPAAASLSVHISAIQIHHSEPPPPTPHWYFTVALIMVSAPVVKGLYFFYLSFTCCCCQSVWTGTKTTDKTNKKNTKVSMVQISLSMQVAQIQFLFFNHFYKNLL